VSAAPSPADRLEEIVSRFAGQPVAVLGDIVCDEFVYGDIARISREAPVLILEEGRIDVVPGGAGNAVANLRALGAAPRPVGIVGDDAAGARILAALRGSGIDVSGIRREPGYGTPTKSRILAGGVHTRRQQIVRIDRGARHGDLSRATVARIAARLARAVRGAAGLLVADYGYGAATPALARAVAESRTVFVDSRARIARYRGIAASTPNQEELERACDVPPGAGARALGAAAARLRATTRAQAVLVTRGARGMLLLERGRKAASLPAFGSGEVADVTGAGDTVIATFALARVSGATYLEAATLANVAAGLVVMKYGTATVTPREIVRALREGPAA
jgi:rfaE bifunctional protein kinase chain/domain